MGLSEERVATEISKTIDKALSSAGLMYRLFYRAKSNASITRKLAEKEHKYREETRKMQDTIGLRVAVYFADDQAICEAIMNDIFQRVEHSIDNFDSNIFGPTRWNVVYRLPSEMACQMEVLKKNELVDDTFEVQFRTILSEGWHEVEHDLRYKCKHSWGNHGDLSRALNGVFATLEVSDWSMLKIFDELALRSYKNQEWGDLVRNKFRLRLLDDSVNSKLAEIFYENKLIAKTLFRCDRNDIIKSLIQLKSPFPITSNNIIFLANRLVMRNIPIINIEPRPIKEILDRLPASSQNAITTPILTL